MATFDEHNSRKPDSERDPNDLLDEAESMPLYNGQAQAVLDKCNAIRIILSRMRQEPGYNSDGTREYVKMMLHEVAQVERLATMVLALG